MDPKAQLWKLEQQLRQQLSDINTPGLTPSTKAAFIQTARELSQQIKRLRAGGYQVAGAVASAIPVTSSTGPIKPFLTTINRNLPGLTYLADPNLRSKYQKFFQQAVKATNPLTRSELSLQTQGVMRGKAVPIAALPVSGYELSGLKSREMRGISLTDPRSPRRMIDIVDPQARSSYRAFFQQQFQAATTFGQRREIARMARETLGPSGIRPVPEVFRARARKAVPEHTAESYIKYLHGERKKAKTPRQIAAIQEEMAAISRKGLTHARAPVDVPFHPRRMRLGEWVTDYPEKSREIAPVFDELRGAAGLIKKQYAVQPFGPVLWPKETSAAQVVATQQRRGPIPKSSAIETLLEDVRALLREPAKTHVTRQPRRAPAPKPPSIRGPLVGPIPFAVEVPEDWLGVSVGRTREQKGWVVHPWGVGPGGRIKHGEPIGGHLYRTRQAAREARSAALATVAARQQQGPITVPTTPQSTPEDVRTILREPWSPKPRPRRSADPVTGSGYSGASEPTPEDVSGMYRDRWDTEVRSRTKAGARGKAQAVESLAAQNQLTKEAGAAAGGKISAQGAEGWEAWAGRHWNRLPTWGKYAVGGIGALLGLRIIASHLGSNEPRYAQDEPHDSRMSPEMRAQRHLQGLGGSGSPLPPTPLVGPGMHESAYQRPYVPFSPPAARVTSPLSASPRVHVVATDTQQRRLDGLGAYLAGQMAGKLDQGNMSVVTNQIGGHSERLELLRDSELRRENRLYA